MKFFINENRCYIEKCSTFVATPKTHLCVVTHVSVLNIDGSISEFRDGDVETTFSSFKAGIVFQGDSDDKIEPNTVDVFFNEDHCTISELIAFVQEICEDIC